MTYQGEILKSTEWDVTIQTSKDTLTIDRSQIANIDVRNSLSLNNKYLEIIVIMKNILMQIIKIQITQIQIKILVNLYRFQVLELEYQIYK